MHFVQYSTRAATEHLHEKSAWAPIIDRKIHYQRGAEILRGRSASSPKPSHGSMCVIESRGSCDMILGRAALASETDRTVNTWVPKSAWAPIIDRKINYQRGEIPQSWSASFPKPSHKRRRINVRHREPGFM
jgi:hypothetical protein